MLTASQVISVLEHLKVGKKGGVIRPHKYLMLLSLIILIEKDKGKQNVFYFNTLESIFKRIIQKMQPHYPYYSNALEYPFYHLQSDRIWRLKIKEGKQKLYKEYQAKRLTKRRILETVEYGYLSKEIFVALQSPLIRQTCKEWLKDVLAKNSCPKSSSKGNDIVLERKSLFEHEQSAIDKIVSSVEGYMPVRCLNNIYIWESQSNTYFEYDLIVIARSGIYVVELKHWTGDIEIKQYQWRINKTKYRVDPHKNNSFKCKVLKGLYKHNFVTYPNVWIESVVVLTNPEANVENADSPEAASQKNRHNLTFGSILDFISYLKRKEKTIQLLNNRIIGEIADFIAQLNKPNVNQREYNVNGYATVEYLSQRPECIELLAKPLGIKAKGLHRLRVFRQIQESQTERERFRKIALNTLNAVEQIDDNPYILKVWTMQSEEGDIIEVSDWSETGTLQDLIYDTEGKFPLKEALTFCKSIALGLKQAHNNNIIHRAVTPENILIKNDVPKLMNFDLSYQLEDNRLTVIPDSHKIKDEGYVAPELLSGKDIDETTDYFSLGVIAYQVLTGEKPFKATRDFIAKGGYLSPQSLNKLVRAQVPESVINGIERMIVADRTKRLQSSKEIISTFTLETEQETQVYGEPVVDNRLAVGAKYDMYEIVEFIGEGREAQLYKAKARLSRGQPTTVVLKVFNHDAPEDRMYNELTLGSEIRSPYVVHYERLPGHWHGERFFIVMDYVPGETLKEIIDRREVPTRGIFDSVARALMQGIRALHENKDESVELRAIVHGDIKPENIIITPKGKPVIIDLGIAGPSRVDAYQGTADYIPPDSLQGADRDFSPRSDLFALGVTLWEWLFRRLPYTSPSIGDNPVIPEDLPGFEDLYPWLKKAVSTKPSEGFASIAEMWDGFTIGMPAETKLEDKDEELSTPLEGVTQIEEPDHSFTGNAFISYLKSLSCDSAGNENTIAENQISNEYFKSIHVINPLTNVIYQLLLHKNVILTGNAGDGKTTIAVDVLKKFIGDKLKNFGSRYEVPEHKLVVIKDMSELSKPERVSVLKEAIDNEVTKYLIVSNTGTLLDAFTAIRVGNNNFSKLLTALKANEPTEIMDNLFCLINIGQLDSIETACKVFERMLHSENWIGCSQCRLGDSCPIFNNIRMLQSNLELTRHRIYLLYKRLYEYGQRLTMRQMTGHLAYAITGGLNCREIANMSLMTRRKNIWQAGFFNRFFGDDGHQLIPNALKLMPVRIIREAGFGLTLMPWFERQAWLKKEAASVFNDEARDVYNCLVSAQAIDNPTLRRQIRRLAYFCGIFDSKKEKEFISIFLDSPMLIDYLEDTCDNNVPLRSHLRKLSIKILHILQEYFTGLRLPEDSWKDRKDIYITLKPPGNVAATQMILARFRQDDFELVAEPRYQYSKDYGSNKVFILKYVPDPDVYLTLDLPFLDYVARRYVGDMSFHLSAYYTNRLEGFKGKLLQTYEKPVVNDTLYLLRIRPDRKFEELTLLVGKDELEVI